MIQGKGFTVIIHRRLARQAARQSVGDGATGRGLYPREDIGWPPPNSPPPTVRSLPPPGPAARLARTGTGVHTAVCVGGPVSLCVRAAGGHVRRAWPSGGCWACIHTACASRPGARACTHTHVARCGYRTPCTVHGVLYPSTPDRPHNGGPLPDEPSIVGPRASGGAAPRPGFHGLAGSNAGTGVALPGPAG